MNPFDHNPFDKYGYFQTAGICLLCQLVALAGLLHSFNFVTLFLTIFFKICFWGAFLKKWQIKDLL